MKARNAAGRDREPGWVLASSNDDGPCYARYAPGKGILHAEARPAGTYDWWLQSRAAATTGPGAKGFPTARDAMRAADVRVTAMPADMFEGLTFNEIWTLGRHLSRAFLRLDEAHPPLSGNWCAAAGLRVEVGELYDYVTDQTLIRLVPRPWPEWSSRHRKGALAAPHDAMCVPARGGGIEATAARLASFDFPAPVTNEGARSPGSASMPSRRQAASMAMARRHSRPRSL